MRFTAPVQSRLSDVDAEVIGSAICTLVEQHRVVTPEIIVDSARADSSPLHGYFEWDDAIAANEYRIEQARYYLRTVHIVRDEESEPIRAFHCVTVVRDDSIERGYVPLQTVVTDKLLIEQVIQNAARELAAWQRRYAQYTELADSVRDVGKVLKRLQA